MPALVVGGCALLLAVLAGLLSRRVPASLGGGSRWLRARVLAPLAAVLGAGAAAVAGSWPERLTYLALALACAVLVPVDLATHRLPDRIVGPMYLVLLVGLTASAAVGGQWDRLGRAGLAAAAAVVCYLALALVAPAGLGLGDVKLAGLLGGFLGWQGWQAVVVGTLAAFVLNGVFVALLLLARRVSRGGEVAFGPAMVLGAVLAAGWTALGAAGPFLS